MTQPTGYLRMEDQEEFEAQQKQEVIASNYTPELTQEQIDELTYDKRREEAEQAERSEYEHAHEVANDEDIQE